jgi:DNA-directed RNA polymerase subunit B
MDNSDAYTTYVCNKCGLFAQRANRTENKSHPSDTDIYQCPACNNNNDVSKIRIPYAFKLFLQELTSMSIAPRIRCSKKLN